MKATPKNLHMLTRFEERMQHGRYVERYQGRLVLLACDLRPGERYHAERLAKLGFFKKATSRAPWMGAHSAVIYYIDETCRGNPFPAQGKQPCSTGGWPPTCGFGAR